MKKSVRSKSRMLNIVVPMAGEGVKFKEAGYTFPKPLIDIKGKPMIQLVIENLRPSLRHRFVLVCKREHYDTYSLHETFKKAAGGNYECIQLIAPTQGAACAVLTTIDFIDNDYELIIANADQLVDVTLDRFVRFARKDKLDGAMITFFSNHPRWSVQIAAHSSLSPQANPHPSPARACPTRGCQRG